MLDSKGRNEGEGDAMLSMKTEGGGREQSKLSRLRFM